MGTVLELSIPESSARTPVLAGGVLAPIRADAAVSETAWLTATIRPAGTFGRNDTSRLRALLDALSACASMVVLDLQVAQQRPELAAVAWLQQMRQLVQDHVVEHPRRHPLDSP